MVEEREKDFESQPILLLDSKETPIVAYVDEGPGKNIQGTSYMYDYTTDFTLDEGSHRGLGFNNETEETPECSGLSFKVEEKESSLQSLPSTDEEMIDENGAHNDTSSETDDDLFGSPEENPAFLSIGGLKIYTRDISDDESDEEELLDEESSDSSETGESTDSSDSGSDIDDEIAADYVQGIGGSDGFLNVDQLVGKYPAVLDDDTDSNDSFDETVEKLGGIALQEASKEYGMMKPQPERKIPRRDHKVTRGKFTGLSAMDDLMLVKDPRTVSGRKKHKTRIPQSWPFESRKSQKGSKIPGKEFHL